MLITHIEECHESTHNMSRDLEMLSIANEKCAPVLRLYSWSEPTISLGKLQKADNILDLERVKADNIVVINRPTGGRAVLHKGDFTYSFCIPLSLQSQFGKNVSQTYASVAQALAFALEELGVETSLSKREVSRAELKSEFKKPCFISPTRNELLVRGRKLIGSAQLRHKNGVIQHGSMPLNTDFSTLPIYERCSQKERLWRIEQLQKQSISFGECANSLFSFDRISQAFIRGFSNAFTEMR